MSTRDQFRVYALAVGMACVLVPVQTAACKGAQGDESIPHLQKQGGVTRLIVDGQPLLLIAGELHNSSSSSLEYLKPIWPRLAAMNLNTVLAAVTWELTEPEEGKFDFTLVDGLIEDARAHDMRLVLLWFASWKNGLSSYAPAWVKTDEKRFPRALDRAGNRLDILSTLGEATRDADARAFAALMRHIREVDGQQHTVVMMQVENEVGVLGDSRDRCAAASAAFAGPVPKEMLDYLEENGETLIPEFRRLWQSAGAKTSGTWQEVFGRVPAADEVFMAFHYARYIGEVAAAGKAEYGIPMYVNAWLDQPDSPIPGQYPSGGPLAQLIDVWRAGAPAIDFLAPDIYAPDFAERCEKFSRSGNPLFIPEALGGTVGAVNAMYAFAQHNALGFAPFGIDGFGGMAATATPESDPLAQSYSALRQLMPLIFEHQGKGTMVGVLPGAGSGGAESSSQQELRLGDYLLTVTFSGGGGFRRGGMSMGGFPGGSSSLPGGMIFLLGPDEYLIVGSGLLNVTFAARAPGPKNAAFSSIDEGTFVDGRWVRGRRLNGDETSHNTSLRMNSFQIYRIKLYRYD